MDQSLSEIGENNAIHVYILHSIAHGCHRLGKSQGKIKFLKVRKIQEKFKFQANFKQISSPSSCLEPLHKERWRNFLFL